MARPGVFDFLDADIRAAIDQAGSIRSLAGGEYLCLEGERSHSLFEIRSGLIRVERSAPDGRVVLLEIGGPGDLFGELGALDGSPRSAAAMAIEPVEALVVSAEALAQLYRVHPEVLLAITKGVAVRMRELTDQLMRPGERSSTAQIAARIVALVDRSEFSDLSGSFTLPMPISQEELGQWSRLSREGTAKALRELRSRGIMSTGRRRLDIHRIDRLRELAVTG
jgi:CRP-like cAMP-binding protein